MNGSENSNEILISDLIKLSIIEKLKYGIGFFEDLELIGKEFILLNSDSKRGKQPSVDIFAYNKINYTLVLIELKVSDSSERSAVTELCAYNQGLQNKFRGLSSLEVIWVPISTEWRVTTKSAVEFTILWQNTTTVPLKMKIIPYSKKTSSSSIRNIELECFNPIESLDEIECLNYFSYECFEAFDYFTMEQIENKDSFINIVSGICSRLRINGFIIFHKPEDMMFPYGFTLCVYNPYKGYLHKTLSQDFIKNWGEKEFYETYKKSGVISTDFTDIDFKNDKIKCFEPTEDQKCGNSYYHDAFWEKDFLGVGEFANNCENQNINILTDKLKEMIDSNGENNRAFGMPNFEVMLNQLLESSVDSIIYVGVYLELISKRITIEHKRGLHKRNFFEVASSFEYLKRIFREYNYK